MKKVLAFCLILLSFASATAEPLTSYQATYSVKSFGMTVGKATRELRITPDGHYQLTMHSWSTTRLLDMDVMQSSEGIYSPLQPLHYEFLQKHGKDNRHNSIDFDWKNKTATSLYKNDTYSIPLTENSQDKISYQLQLQQEAGNDQNEWTYSIIEEKRTDIYQFHRTGHERIILGDGKEVDMIKFSKDSDENKRSTEIWLAPEYNFLVVKLVHVEHGVSTTLLLTEYKNL